MLVPHDSEGKTLSFRLPLSWIYAGVGLLLFSFLLVGSSLVYSAMLSRRLVHYHKSIAKNREQQKVINVITHKTHKVNQAIDALVQEDNRLRKLLGLKSWKNKMELSSDYNSKHLTKAQEASQVLNVANQKLEKSSKSFSELKNWVNDIRQRYSATPSRWPLYGNIVSRYGYRIYPWRGFHTGIDISGRYGAPVMVTADGVVTFVGWRQGYGKTVIVQHNHGASTLYAHSSRFAVKRGQKVTKGQVVCYVGNTGYTTGPHLHYEVRKANRAVNPITYLNLNILTASRIWGR